jgi:hypothetical protein
MPCRYQGQWRAGKRHGQGACLFADGTRFSGLWEDDEWVQSAADPGRCRAAGKGLSRAVAGQTAEFTIEVGCRRGRPLGRLPAAARPGAPQMRVLHAAAVPCPPAAAAGCRWDWAICGRGPSEACCCGSCGSRDVRRAPAAQARDDQGQRRLSGGDAFSVTIAPCSAGACSSTAARGASASAPAFSSAAAPAAGPLLPAHVEDLGDGTHLASYCITAAGRHQLHVTSPEGTPVADSPYPLLVRGAAVPAAAWYPPAPAQPAAQPDSGIRSDRYRERTMRGPPQVARLHEML